MAKKYILSLEKILKRNNKYFNTKFIVNKLNSDNLVELNLELEKNKNKIRQYLLNFRLDTIEDNNGFKDVMNKDVNDFLERMSKHKKRKIIRKSKFNIKGLEEQFSNNNTFYPNSKTIKEKYEIMNMTKGPSNSYLNYVLKKHLKIKYKKHSLVHTKSSTELSNNQKLLYIHKIAKELSEGGNLIFIDATKIKNDKNSQKFWQRIDKHDKYLNNGRVEGLNVLGAISSSGILNFYYSNENINSSHFLIFLKEVQTKSVSEGILNPVIVLDNCAYQKSTEIKKFAKKSNIKLVFLPCYMPFLNSIEYLWNVLKKEVRKEIIKST